MGIQQTLTALGSSPWAPTLNYVYAGPQLSPIGHIAMQVRLYAGASDPPLLTINPIASVDTDNGDGTRTLSLSPSLSAAQMQALPAAAAQQMAAQAVLANLPAAPGPEIGQMIAFAFDIRITYADGTTEVLAFGTFNVLPGVTTV